MNSDFVTVTQRLYGRLDYIKNSLTADALIYYAAKIEFSPDEETLRLRLGESTLVYCDLARDEYEIFIECGKYYKKIASGLDMYQAIELLKTMPESAWNLNRDQFTRIQVDGDEGASEWIENFIKADGYAI